MPHVIFFTDIFKEAGFGHFVRSFSLAEEFIKRKCRVSFISEETSEPIKKILKKKKIIILNLKDLKSFQKNNKIIIIDSYTIENEVIDFINKFFFSVIFDDFDKKLINSNVVIKNNLGQMDKNDNPINQIVGKKYCIIRKEVLKNKSYNFVKKEPKFCYITFGGYNKEFELLNFFNNLKNTKYFSNNSLKLYINIKLFHNKVKKIFKDSENIEINFVDLKLGNNFKFNKIDMSINGGGITSVEMVYLKIPQIVMCLSSDQKSNVNFIKENKLGYIASKNILRKDIKIDSDVNKFIQSYTMLKKNLISRNYIDNLGTNRIVSRVIKVYKNEK
tara:strand:+ start:183 stop:1175 length:993 start_codon:yes stop_codon:yes gene_type:complete